MDKGLQNIVILRYFPTGFILAIGILVLTGCDQFSSKTVAQMCQENPEFCSDLNPDSWCRAEKADIIKHRYEHFENQSNRDQYQLLVFFEHYKDCIEKAAQIRHIKLREKETGRMKGVLTAQRELKRIANETRNIDDPYLNYYHWSRFGSDSALRRFLNDHRSGRLNSAELNVGLASYFAKLDSGKAINALYTALSLYNDEQMVDPEIFISLYTLHTERDEVDRAITWGLIGSEYESNNVDTFELESVAEQHGLDINTLKKKAKDLHSKIEDRDFVFSQ